MTQTKLHRALAVLAFSPKDSPICWQWVVLVCPFCGGRHMHGAGSVEGAARKFLGSRLAHCQTALDPQLEKGDYELVEAPAWAASRLLVASRDKWPFKIADRKLKKMLSRHRSRDAAARKLPEIRQSDPWATVINLRLQVLGDVLEQLDEQAEGGASDPPAGPAAPDDG